jgi:hypothetical protein
MIDTLKKECQLKKYTKKVYLVTKRILKAGEVISME